MVYYRWIFLRFEVKQHVSTLYGHHQVLSIEVSLYKLHEKGCDVEISHLFIGRGVLSWGCQLDVNLPFFRGVAVKAVDGWPQREQSQLWENIECERSIMGTRCHVCVCLGVVYENGTYMYGGVPVCLYLL